MHYTAQDIIDRFKAVPVVQVGDKKYRTEVKGDIVVLHNRKTMLLLGKSDIHKRWGLVNGKLHFIRRNLVTKKETFVNGEIS